MSRAGSHPTEARFLKVVESIYDAALDRGLWEEVAASVAELSGGRRGMLGITSPNQPASAIAASFGFDPDIVARWSSEFDGFDPFYERMGALPAGAARRGWAALPLEELRAIDVYRAVFHPARADDVLTTSLSNQRGSVSFLSIHRSLDEGDFDESNVAVFARLAPHLARAVEIRRRLQLADGHLGAVEQILSQLAFGVALLDPARRVRWANAEAVRIAASGDGASLVQDRLRIDSSATAAALERACLLALETARGSGAGGASALSVPRRSGRRPYQLLVAPVPRRASLDLFSFERGRAALLVVLCDPDSVPELRAEHLRGLFGLTPALARLAAALAGGATLAEYSGAQGISVGTARQQLKELFARTGTSRQADLVRVMLSSVAALLRPGEHAELR